MPLWQAKGESQNFPEQLVGVLQVLSMEAETKTIVRMEKKVFWQCPQDPVLLKLLSELIALQIDAPATASAYSLLVLFPRARLRPGN